MENLDEIEDDGADQIARVKRLMAKKKEQETIRAERMKRKISTLYLIEQMNGAAVKGGISSDPKKRMAQLQVGSDKALALINFTVLWHDDAVKIEKAIHRNFQQSAIHASGEWYYCRHDFATRIIERAIRREKGMDFDVWMAWRKEFDEWVDGAV